MKARVGAHRRTLSGSAFPAAMRLALALALAVFGATVAQATDTTCDGTTRDAAGYVCSTFSGDRIPDISSDGTAITSWSPKGCGGDDCYKLADLPTGASFRWYGSSYASVYVGSNGYLTFGSGVADEVSALAIPTSAVPNNVIYAYGDDLVPNTSTDLVYHKAMPCTYDGDSDGTNDDCFVVQWHALPIYGVGSSSVTVQLALDLVTNEALVEVESETDSSGLRPQLVGAENAAGAIGLWYKGSGDPDSRDAASGGNFALSPDTTPPTVVTTTPADDAEDVPLSQQVQATFDKAMNTSSVALTVFGGPDPGGWSSSWSGDSKTVTYTHTAFADSATLVLRIAGQDSSGNPLGDVPNGNPTCTGGYCWNFDTLDVTAPANVTKLTSASGTLEATLEFVPSASSDEKGCLVLRRAGTAVDAAPAAGQTYTVGELIGGNEVVSPPETDSPWTDTTVSDGTIYHYKVFAHDDRPNYATGVAITGRPRVSSDCKWIFGSSATTLAPVGVAGDETGTSHLVVAGNDQLLQRMAESDGQRGSWTPPALGGACQHRPVVGDPLTGGVTEGLQAFLGTHAGRLLRYDLSTQALTSANVIADAGCGAGILQAGPAVMVDAYDANDNDDDDAVIQATRCGATNNRVLLYDHELDLKCAYAPAGGLGISNGQPMILYRDDALNLAFVSFRQEAAGPTGKSMVVLEVNSVGGEPCFVDPDFALLRGIGDLDAGPIVFSKTEGAYVVVGNTEGVLFLYRADSHIDADGTGAGVEMTLPLQEVYDGADNDGPVKGLSVSTPIPAGGGLEEVWVAWSTDTQVHAIKVDGAGQFDETTHRFRTLSAPSAPLVLRNVRSGVGPYIYVGAGDGAGYELDVTSESLAITRTFTVESGKTVGEATLDYHDGADQGVVFGATNGSIYRFKLN